jgi:hypothetical protein
MSERRDYRMSVGNVKIRFTDGHTEIWTRDGKSLMPQVSSEGHVRWTHYARRNHYQGPVNSTLRIRFIDGRLRDFLAYPNGPFIEQWAFVDNSSAVVIKSRGRHGPAYYVKYDLRTGKRIGSVGMSTPKGQPPQWAQPYAD